MNYNPLLNTPFPGDSVQIHVSKIGIKCYQFTAIDDCPRLRTLRIYPNKKSTIHCRFLGHTPASFSISYIPHHSVILQTFFIMPRLFQVVSTDWNLGFNSWNLSFR